MKTNKRNSIINLKYWNDYRDKIKTLYPTKPTVGFVDELFANWQD